MTNVKSDVISGITDNWNTGITSIPAILDGEREKTSRRDRKRYKNVVFVYDNGARYDLVEPNHTYKDGFYNIKLDIETTQSESKRDNIVSECKRIIGQTGITGYDNKKIIFEKNYGQKSKWNCIILFQLTKYSELI